MFTKRDESGPVTSEKVDTILGKGTEFTGQIKSSGIVRIEGKLDGELETSQDLIIAQEASVKAQVKARHAVISGTYHGNLDLSGKLEIKSTGRVFGNIKVSGIIIEDGGVFEGECNMAKSDPKAAVKDKKVNNTNPA